MARKLAELFVSLTADSAKFKAGLTDAQKAAQRWRKQIQSDVSGLRGSYALLTKAVGGFAAVLAGRGIANAVGEQVRLKAAMADTARALGVSTVEYSKFAFAAERFGVQQSAINVIIQRMVRNVSEAAQGFGEAQKAIAVLNLDARELRSLAPDEQFARIVEQLARLDNAGDRFAVARKIFDSEGAAAALKMAEGFRKATEDAERLGVTLSQDAAEGAVQARQAFNDLSAIMDQLKENVAIPTALAIAEVAAQLFNVETAASSLSRSGILKEMERNAVQLGKARKELDRALAAQPVTVLGKPLEFAARAVDENLRRAEKAYDDALRRAEELQTALRNLDVTRTGAGGLSIAGLSAGVAGGAGASGEAEQRRRAGESARQQARVTLEAYRLETMDARARIMADLERDLATVREAVAELGMPGNFAESTLQPIEEGLHRNAMAALDDIDARADKSQEKLAETVQVWQDFTRRARENFQDILSDGLEGMFSNFDKGLDRLLSSFIETLKKMAFQALSVQIFKAGGGGFFGNLFGSIFGQAHATNAYAGNAYRVEPGRSEGETFIPGMDGRFFPDSMLTSSPMSVAVTVGAPVINLHGGMDGDTVTMLRAELHASERRQARLVAQATQRAVLQVRDDKKRRRF